MYSKPPPTLRDLFASFPHWAVKLHFLYAEADDPTPITWAGRWAERRRSSMHAVWLTCVALVAAIAFGALASVLAAVQLWISDPE